MVQSMVGSRPRDDGTIQELPESELFGRSCCLALNLSCFKSRRPGDWERISPPSLEEQENVGGHSSLLENALKKLREWSEIVTRPKWKTFTRRFNKIGGRSRTSRFHYDSLSYHLNFDEGSDQEGRTDGDHLFRGFSARYAGAN